jgi:hypothetical protein
MDKIMRVFRVYGDYEDYLIVMDFVYDPEYFPKLFADGWKILTIRHNENTITLYKKHADN